MKQLVSFSLENYVQCGTCQQNLSNKNKTLGTERIGLHTKQF